MRRRPAAAPDTPPSNKKQSTGSCTQTRGRGPAPAQDLCDAPHDRLQVSPGSRPSRRPPRRCSPTRHVPRQQQRVRGKENITSSATSPSTERCSKDVTTHQHRPGARPGRPCPVKESLSVRKMGRLTSFSCLAKAFFSSTSLFSTMSGVQSFFVSNCFYRSLGT
jgi:hypothetical protein